MQITRIRVFRIPGTSQNAPLFGQYWKSQVLRCKDNLRYVWGRALIRLQSSRDKHHDWAPLAQGTRNQRSDRLRPACRNRTSCASSRRCVPSWHPLKNNFWRETERLLADEDWLCLCSQRYNQSLLEMPWDWSSLRNDWPSCPVSSLMFTNWNTETQLEAVEYLN